MGICIEVESTRFLTTLSPVINTLLPFSSKNEDKVFNHGVLASKEKSPPSSSHRGFKASKLSHLKSLMMISGGDIPILDVPFLHFSISILLDQLKYGGLSQTQDLVNKNKRFVGGNPCLSLYNYMVVMDKCVVRRLASTFLVFHVLLFDQDCSDFEASRAHGFVLRSLEL
ncbi:hypothetical protein Tco_0334420 [Tanacetum coccineum]